MIRLVPIALTGGLGGVDGIVRRMDVNATEPRANPDGSAVEGKFPFSVLFEGLLAFGGAGLDIMRTFSTDITEPVIYAGATLLGQRAGNFVGKMSEEGAIPGQMAVPYYGGNGARAVAAGGWGAPALARQEERQYVFG